MADNIKTSGSTTKTSPVGSAGLSGVNNFPISLGYVGAAQIALLAAMKNNTQIQQIDAEAAIGTLKSMNGYASENGWVGGTAQADADAACAADWAQADEFRQDMISSLTQMSASTVSLGVDAACLGSYGKEKAAEENLKSTRKFSETFEAQKELKAGAELGNGPVDPTDEVKARAAELTSSTGALKVKPGDDQAIQHILTDPKQSEQLAERINKAENTYTNEIQSAQSTKQRITQMVQTGTNMVGQAATAATAAEKSNIEKDEKAPASKTRSLAQAGSQTLQSALSNFLEGEKSKADEVAALRRAKEVLGSNNGTAGQ